MEVHEPEQREPNDHAPEKEPWFGKASMVFGLLAFVTAILSFLGASASTQAHYQVRREDYGGYTMHAYTAAILLTMVPAFGSVVSCFIAAHRGERSRWLLIPGLLWLSPVLLFGLLALIIVGMRLR